MIKNPKREHASDFFEHGILKDEHGDCGGEHGLSTEAKSAHGAGAPSAPSEEGAGFLRRLRRKKTEGEIMRACGVRQGTDAH